MGLFFRKSVSFGPFRLNFSKSGIGISAGVKGARISTGPSGTFIHAGTHGFYYREKIGSTSNQPLNSNVSSPNEKIHFYSGVETIQSGEVSQFRDSSTVNLINKINKASSETAFAPWAIVSTLIVALGFLLYFPSFTSEISSSPEIKLAISVLPSIAVLALGLLLSWQIHKGDELKRTTPLFYELDTLASKRFDAYRKALVSLANTSKIWRLNTKQSTTDTKRNAGASNLIGRNLISSRLEQPPYIATNVQVWSIQLGNQVLYFMPDFILVRQDKRYGAVPYEKLDVTSNPTRFIEEEGVPQDSKMVGSTWKYVNKDGGPDRRFSNNRQLPIMEYGFLHISSKLGMNFQLHVSRAETARYFATAFADEPRTSRESHQRNSTNADRPNATPDFDVEVRTAFSTLDVSIDATFEEITAAYRQKAKMYHPDKVAHLAPEFIEIAEGRMKEINLAYERLKFKKST